MSDPSEVCVKPTARRKKDIIPPIDSDTVHCRLCPKDFASDMALRNHAKMEHINVYLSGDPRLWTLVEHKPSKSKPENENLICFKTKQVLPEIEPTSVMTLVSNDHSYIKIKEKELDGDGKRKRIERVIKKRGDSGPFKCLQPLTQVADSTCHKIFFSCCEYSIHNRDEHNRSRKGLKCQVCEKPLSVCEKATSGAEEQVAPHFSKLKPQDMLSTNTLKVVSELHSSLGPALQDSTECHVSEDIIDAELDQLHTEDIVTEAQEEQCSLIKDNNQSSHLEDPVDIINEEADDVETDAEYINLENGIIKIEEIGSEPDIAGPTLQLADNIICPKIVKVVLERIDLNDSRVGARVSKKPKIAAMKDTEDATTCKETIEVIKNKQSYLKIHIRTHSGEEPYQCNVCKKSFTQKGNLQTHIRTHNGDKPYKCIICKTRFTQKVNLQTHIRTHSGDKPYKCNICKAGFTLISSLTSHIRTHSGEKPYQCNVCKKCFTQSGNYHAHIRTHNGEKPYECNVCKKCFTRKSYLKVHIRKHYVCEYDRGKPYKCDICKKCFSLKNNLKRHSLTHSGEKPYQCNVCGKCLTRKSHLKDHIRRHSGGNIHVRTHTSDKRDKPYQCNICKKCFSFKHNLKIHIRIHSGEKPSM